MESSFRERGALVPQACSLFRRSSVRIMLLAPCQEQRDDRGRGVVITGVAETRTASAHAAVYRGALPAAGQAYFGHAPGALCSDSVSQPGGSDKCRRRRALARSLATRANESESEPRRRRTGACSRRQWPDRRRAGNDGSNSCCLACTLQTSRVRPLWSTGTIAPLGFDVGGGLQGLSRYASADLDWPAGYLWISFFSA